ncbi:Glycine-rich RNA-binding protein 3, mitochondrial [Apostasia shenzhenica]|uniref:Glycine-rich RNA-binding protein 3, mitochondrial n=1 Tax=Apostasia shenzhenica TaxID=1088818 RepID=A0A2I0A486_9ASPA|nr:Glycine-rich RNA-binding protein 3, mitochondrial [Apostasia shenzhenica]
MAFVSKVGSLLRKSVSSNPLIAQAVRCMSSSKLFVGGLSYSTDDQSLREAFSGYGEVVESRVIMDRETGRSRGFGFITYTSTEEASAAMTAMDGKVLPVLNYKFKHFCF